MSKAVPLFGTFLWARDQIDAVIEARWPEMLAGWRAVSVGSKRVADSAEWLVGHFPDIAWGSTNPEHTADCLRAYRGKVV